MSNINTDEIWDLVIGGERVVPGGTYEVIDPNTTQVVGHAPEATAEHACQAAAAAKEAFPKWRDTDMAERCSYLASAAELIEQRCGDWVDLVQAETGSTINVTETMQAVSYTHLTLPTKA